MSHLGTPILISSRYPGECEPLGSIQHPKSSIGHFLNETETSLKSGDGNGLLSCQAQDRVTEEHWEATPECCRLKAVPSCSIFCVPLGSEVTKE